jgi:hypothetical protein
MRLAKIIHQKIYLADLQYPRGFDDRRFSLPFRKLTCLVFIGVYASKTLSIFIKHRDLPMPVFAPFVFSQLCAFSYRFGFRHGLNISIRIRARKYQFGQYLERYKIILHSPKGSKRGKERLAKA